MKSGQGTLGWLHDDGRFEPVRTQDGDFMPRERIAYALRVLELVEASAAKPMRCQGPCEDCTRADVCSNILIEAKKETDK